MSKQQWFVLVVAGLGLLAGCGGGGTLSGDLGTAEGRLAAPRMV